MRNSFLSPLIVEVLPSGKRFKLHRAFTLRDQHTKTGIRVAAGFVTDLASIPTSVLLWLAAGLILAGHYFGIDWLLLVGVALILLGAIIPKLGRQNKAAVIHDALYQGAFTILGQPFELGDDGFSRKDADQIFRAAMGYLNVPRWKREVIYWAVRLGGHWSWRKK